MMNKNDVFNNKSSICCTGPTVRHIIRFYYLF